MSFLYPSNVINYFSSFFQMSKSSDVPEVILSGSNCSICLPSHPLAQGSVKLVPNNQRTDASLYQQEAYNMIQDIIKIWAAKGVTDYLIYGTPSVRNLFSWEIVPFPKTGWKLWQQIKLLWNVTFGGSRLSESKRNQISQELREKITCAPLAQQQQIKKIADVSQKNDAFCRAEIINKQCVFEGKEIRVLFNYAPIGVGKEKLHFLLIPKKHREKYEDLTFSESEEADELSKKLILHFDQLGYKQFYLYSKNGAQAAQTVFHWHQHLIFTATKAQDLWSKFIVFKNMFFRSHPMSDKELASKVEYYRNVFLHKA